MACMVYALSYGRSMRINAFNKPSSRWPYGIPSIQQAMSIRFEGVQAARAEGARAKQPTKTHPFT
jgi:hypothetical protein